MGPFLFYSGIYSIMAKKLVITESQLRRMVQNEQLLKGLGQKIKSGVNAGLDQVKTGINKVATKVADLTQKPQANQPDAQPTKQSGRKYEEVKSEWTKINQNMEDMRAFGEAVGQTHSSAVMAAQFNARVILLKKIGKEKATIGSSPIDEVTFELPNGNYQHLVLMQLTKQY